MRTTGLDSVEKPAGHGESTPSRYSTETCKVIIQLLTLLVSVVTILLYSAVAFAQTGNLKEKPSNKAVLHLLLPQMEVFRVNSIHLSVGDDISEGSKRNPGCSPEIVAAEAAGGLMMGLVGTLPGGTMGYYMYRYSIALGLASEPEGVCEAFETYWCGLMVGSAVGYVAGSAIGIWMVGKQEEQKGSLVPTLVGAVGGALPGVLLAQESGNVYPFLILPLVGGVIGYNVSID